MDNNSRRVLNLHRTLDFVERLAKLVLLVVAILILNSWIDKLSGGTTLEEIGGALKTIMGPPREWIRYAGWIILLIWGWKERKSRLKKLKHLGPRVKRLEQLMDPDRSSSNLTKTGDTNPEDE